MSKLTTSWMFFVEPFKNRNDYPLDAAPGWFQVKEKHSSKLFNLVVIEKRLLCGTWYATLCCYFALTIPFLCFYSQCQESDPLQLASWLKDGNGKHPSVATSLFQVSPVFSLTPTLCSPPQGLGSGINRWQFYGSRFDRNMYNRPSVQVSHSKLALQKLIYRLSFLSLTRSVLLLRVWDPVLKPGADHT